MLPVVSPVPGQVDLLVVTRDVWSLRFNTNFEYQGNALTLIETSLSENNLFGWRKFLSVRFNRDQGTYNYGPDYFDPNIHGTRMVLRASALFYTSRETGRYEGDAELVSLHYPLYSLATSGAAASTSSTRTSSSAASAATACGWWTWRGRRCLTSTGGTS